MSSFPDELKKVFTEKKVKKVLDLGSGEGNILIMLAQLGFDVTGIEISKEGVKKTKDSAKLNKVNVNIINSDIYETLPFQDNTFDAVIGLQSINHNGLKEIEKLILEIKRILKPNGIIGIKTAHRESYNLEKLKENIYKDIEFGDEFEFLDFQTYIPISGDEKGIKHYAFYFDQLRGLLSFKGFNEIDSKKTKWHILAIYEKK